VHFGVEDRESESVAGQPVAILYRDAVDGRTYRIVELTVQ
jgi:hypothetical protein